MDSRLTSSTVDLPCDFLVIERQLLCSTRSSPDFWRLKKAELMCLIRHLGIPTFFLTYSPAETSWFATVRGLIYFDNRRRGVPDFLVSDDDIRNMSRPYLRDLLASNPVVATEMIRQRHEALWSEILLSSNGPLGKIKDFYYRVEFQMRGSPHFHVILWIEDSPKFNITESSSFDTVVEYVDKYITCSYMDASSHFREHLRCQIHSHSASCRRNNKCRYRFPLPPLKNTMLLLPLNLEETQLEEKERIRNDFCSVQELLNNLITGDISSIDEMLTELGFSYSYYVKILRYCYLDRPLILLKRLPGEVWINKYNKIISQCWEGNMDLTFVLDAYACAKYIINYITKSYRELSKTMFEYRKKLMSDDRPVNSKLCSLITKFVNCSQMGIQESIFHILGHPLSKSSRNVVFVNTSLPERRIRLPLVNSTSTESIAVDLINSFEIDTAVMNDFADGLFEHYLKRNTALETICFGEWCQQYYYRTKGSR